MTNSQPIATPQALNFTPDNKHAYAYGGVINAITQDVAVDLIDFQTNSEYTVAKFQFGIKHDTGNNISYGVFFNDVRIAGYATDGGVGDSQQNNYIPLIIPPFTKVVCTGTNNSSNNDIPLTCTMIGEVYGMTETGYQ